MAGTMSMAARAANIMAKAAAAGIDLPAGLSASQVYKRWQAMSATTKVAAAQARAAVDPAYARTARSVVSRIKGGKAPRIVDVAGNRAITSSDKRFLRQQLKAAAAAGKRVSVRITATDNNGTRTRDIANVTPRVGAILDSAEPGEGRAAESNATLVGKVKLVIGDTHGRDAVFSGDRGIDARDLLDFLDSYEDWDDAWLDLWDSEYG